MSLKDTFIAVLTNLVDRLPQPKEGSAPKPLNAGNTRPRAGFEDLYAFTTGKDLTPAPAKVKTQPAPRAF